MLAAALSASCGLGTGKLGRPKLPTVRWEDFCSIPDSATDVEGEEKQRLRETERCRVELLLAVRSVLLSSWFDAGKSGR